MKPVFALTAALCLAAVSCASRGPSPEPTGTAVVSLAFGHVEFQAVDIDSVRVSLDLDVVNAGGLVIVPASLDYAATAGERTIEGRRELDRTALAPGASATVAMSFEMDTPPGDSTLVPVALKATMAFSTLDGIPGSVTASVVGDFPRVMPPVLVITSIQILKDELINTRLGVNLEVRNPNAFPLAFASLDYRLFGDGRYWASGSMSRSFIVPAVGSASASIYMTMNFADMDRSLLDRVIKLAFIDYRLVGTGHIGTGLEFLPEFALPFDLSGRVGVDR